MRSNYWSHSNFAIWIIKTFGGVAQLESGTSAEWSAWRKAAKQHKLVYWFTEEFLSALQNFVNWPNDRLGNIRYYLFNRFISKTHYMHTRLTPGQYYDLDTKMLHGMFEELVDFVEVEKAWMQVCWGDKSNRDKYATPWWRTTWYVLRWKEWRCAQAGLDHLNWEMNLINNEDWVDKDSPQYGLPTFQATNAKEQFELYKWWKIARVSRPDPYDESGWSAYCDNKRKVEDSDDVMAFFNNDDTDALKLESKTSLTKLHNLEQQFDDEDTEMLCRLIRIRKSLWT